jgi:hypothetical protein
MRSIDLQIIKQISTQIAGQALVKATITVRKEEPVT